MSPFLRAGHIFSERVTYVTQHDKTHKSVPENKKLLVSYERATLQLFNGGQIISIMHSVGKLWTLKVEKQ